MGGYSPSFRACRKPWPQSRASYTRCMVHAYNFIILVLRGGGRKFNGDLKVILSYAEMEVSMGERACVKKEDEMEQTEQTNINAPPTVPQSFRSSSSPFTWQSCLTFHSVKDNPWPSEKHLLFQGIAAVSFRNVMCLPT